MEQYGEETYWETRYQGLKDYFDWFHRWAGLREIVSSNVGKEDLILNIGCGNSRMSEEMFEAGYERIISTDISSAVVKFMTDKCRNKRDQFYYKQMDVTQSFEFETSQFDCVLDKGCLDCIFCGDKSISRVQHTLKEIDRVLRQGGVYICISHAGPERRVHHFEDPDLGWEVKVEQVIKVRQTGDESEEQAEPEYHHIYICVKTNSVELTQEDSVEPLNLDQNT